MKIAVGPSLHYPSWHWCMGDLIPDLKTHHNITVFDKYNKLKNLDFDLLIAVKFPPPSEFQAKTKRIIYLPVDYFREESQITKHSPFLRSCNLIAVHCSRLDNFLKPYCNRIEFIEHYGKYTLTNLARFRRKGLVIWTGARNYVNFVLEWYNKKPRNFQLTVLTDKLPLNPQNHLNLFKWSNETQEKCFNEAKAGIDMKGTSFGQQTKPPTKIQQLIASGIPAAINRASYSWEYFHKHGLDLADPDDNERWFSETYWKEVHDFAPGMRQTISKTNVVQNYLNLINTA